MCTEEKTMIKYVFLDIDDTLLDFGKAEARSEEHTSELQSRE